MALSLRLVDTASAEADEIVAAGMATVAVSAEGNQESLPARNSVAFRIPGVQLNVEAPGTFCNAGL